MSGELVVHRRGFNRRIAKLLAKDGGILDTLTARAVPVSVALLASCGDKGENWSMSEVQMPNTESSASRSGRDTNARRNLIAKSFDRASQSNADALESARAMALSMSLGKTMQLSPAQ